MGNGQSCGHSNGRSVRHGHQTRTSKRSSVRRANGQIGQSGGQSRGHDQARTTGQSSTNRANGQINHRPTEQSNGRRLLNHRMGYRYVSFRDSSSNIQVSLRLQV